MKDFYSSGTAAGRFTPDSSAETPVFLAAEQILIPNIPKNAKKEQNAVIRLAASIKKYGILEPLCVKVSPQRDGFPLYELIDGERRFRAAALVGIGKLPCLILAPNDKKCLKSAAISGLRQEKLHFFALSEAFLHLMDKYQMTQEEIAEKMGLSQSAVANKLRLLRLSPEERRLIVSGGLTERHARAFLRLSDPQKRAEAITISVREGYNVAKTEALVAQIAGEKGREADLHEPTPEPSEQGTCNGKPPIWAKNQPEIAEKRDFWGKNDDFEPGIAPKPANETTSEPPLSPTPSRTLRGAGVMPRKFAMRDLKPLYNSIERTLGIFEKTGVCAEYSKQEDENFAHIVIRIPK